MRATIEKISEVLVDLEDYKQTANETITAILEDFNPQITKEETSAMKKVAKALASSKMDKLKDENERLAEMMGVLE